MKNEKELRIDNLVCWTDDPDWNPMRVVGINKDAEIFVQCKFEDGTTDTNDSEIKDIGSILLNESWLISFGFKIKEETWYSIKTKNRWIRLEVSIKEERCILFDTKKITFCDIFFPKSVHQLQNLFQAITGEELTLKP